MLLDARRDLADGCRPDRSWVDDDVNPNDVVLLMNHGNLVMGKLREGPRTVPELAAACGLTQSRVRDAIEVAADVGMVYRLDGPGHIDWTGRYAGQYTFDESKAVGWSFVRGTAARLARRLARPLR